MTRVALLPSAYLPTLGGVQELSRQLALALRATGNDVEIWWQQRDGLRQPTCESIDGLVVRRFPFPLPDKRVRSVLAAAAGLKTLRAMRQAVTTFRPDLLHVQCFGPNGAYAVALSALTHVPLVISLQGETMMDDHDIFDRSTTLRTALRLGLRRAAAVTGCSQFTIDDAVARFGLTVGRAQVIFNGVDLDQREACGMLPGPEGRYVIALGRVVEKKGFDLLLRGFAAIAAKHPNVTLAIGGEGDALTALKSLADELAVRQQVRFLGRLSREQVAAAMNRAEIFVMPSRLEPFGIVVLEAWRAGRATIATSHGGPPEFIEHGVTGLLVDPFDAGAVASALDRLLSDETLRETIGCAGRRRASDFAWPEIASQYQNHVYDELGFRQ